MEGLRREPWKHGRMGRDRGIIDSAIDGTPDIHFVIVQGELEPLSRTVERQPVDLES